MKHMSAMHGRWGRLWGFALPFCKVRVLFLSEYLCNTSGVEAYGKDIEVFSVFFSFPLSFC